VRSESRKIGGHRYTVTMLLLDQWQDLRDAVWPTLMGVIPDVVEADKVTKEQLTDVVRSASVLLPLQPESYRTAIRLLHECSEVDGQAGRLSDVGEIWWAEQGYAELGEWLAFALEIQLVPFLHSLPLASLRRLAQGRPSASPITSTGMSGGLSAKGTGL